MHYYGIIPFESSEGITLMHVINLFDNCDVCIHAYPQKGVMWFGSYTLFVA